MERAPKYESGGFVLILTTEALFLILTTKQVHALGQLSDPFQSLFPEL